MNSSRSARKGWGVAAPVSLTLALLVISCNKEFSPKAPFSPQPVVYSILYCDNPQQYVRVSSTFDVDGYNPYVGVSDQSITGAKVVITGPRGVVLFRDTLLQGSGTPATPPVHAYVADWRPEPGQVYTLDVDADRVGRTSGTVSVPAMCGGRSWYPDVNFLDLPDSNLTVTLVSSFFTIPSAVRVFFSDVYVVYAVQLPDKIQEVNVAIPGTGLGPNIAYNVQASVWCYRPAISNVLHQVAKKYVGSKLTFKRIVYRIYMMDDNWYKYYSVVHRLFDTTTTRFDQPDFSTMSQGYGVFGACTLDSAVHNYPVNFELNH